MLARLDFMLPVILSIPRSEKFDDFQYEDQGHTIQVFPYVDPSKKEVDKSLKITIDGEPAYQTNILRVIFKKDSFNRDEGSVCDPEHDFINRVINAFLKRLRFVTRASKITQVDLMKTAWELRYLNDDGSELEQVKGCIRGRGGAPFHISWIAVNNNTLKWVYDLSLKDIPPWEMLLLDADNIFPEVGPTIVLVSTALEVFISCMLDQWSNDSTIPKDLWLWINNRDWWLKNPSLTEQYDILLKTLLGFSLKADNNLWECFVNLKDARNSFVHEGIAKIGEVPLSEEETLNLKGKAREIIDLIKTKLPERMQWPEYKQKLNIAGERLLRLESEGDTLPN